MLFDGYDYHDTELELAKAEFFLSGKKTKTLALDSKVSSYEEHNNILQQSHEAILITQNMAKQRTRRY